MANPEFTFRPRTGPVIATCVWALIAWALASLASTEPSRLVVWLPLAAWAGLTASAVFWSPRVVVGEHGLEVRNVTATHDVPWAAIARVDTKWALTLHTAQGRVTAFAAPAPSGLRAAGAASRRDLRHLPESAFDAARSVRPGDLPGAPSGDLAWVVRERWEATRDAGATGAASDETPTRRWHVRSMTAWTVLAALTAVALALA